MQLSIANFKLVDAGSPVFPGEGHAHILIDRAPAGPGQPLPTGQADIIHIGSAPYDARTLDLTPGRHRLVVQLADSSHNALHTPVVSDVTFLVGTGPSFRGQGPLEPACAEVASGSGMLRLVFPMQGGLAQGVIDSRCNFVTEGGVCGFMETSSRRIIGHYDERTRLVNGKVLGRTIRELTSGSPQQCGAPVQENQVPEAPFSAALVGNQVSGALGSSNFILTPNENMSLATPVDFSATGTTTTPTTTPAEEASASRDGLPVGRIALGVGAAVVLGGVLLTPVIRRRSGFGGGGG